MKALYDAVRHLVDSGILDRPGVGIAAPDGGASISPHMRKALLDFEKRNRDHHGLLDHPDLHARHMSDEGSAPSTAPQWCAEIRQQMYDAYVDLFLTALGVKWHNEPFAPELNAVLDAYDPQGYVARLARYEASNRLQHHPFKQGSPPVVVHGGYLNNAARPYQLALAIERDGANASRTVTLADIDCSTLRGACELMHDARQKAAALFEDIDSWPEFSPATGSTSPAAPEPQSPAAPANANMGDGIKVALPAGLIDILREAAAIIANIDPDHAPANLRLPIVDELEGFASMLYGESRAAGIGPTVEARALTGGDVQEMRLALARIYHGRYTACLSARLSDTAMADIAEPFALTLFVEPSPEHQALHAIYLGRYCADPAKRLTDTQLAEIAKPFVVVPDSSGSMADSASPPGEKRHYIVLRVTPPTSEQAPATGTSPPAEAEPDVRAPPARSMHAAVADALMPFCTAGQRVIWQERSAWHDENGELAAPYCYMPLSKLVDELDYDVLADYNHVGVIKRRA
jgi:hypothetical protein